jgi:hypothetical protein
MESKITKVLQKFMKQQAEEFDKHIEASYDEHMEAIKSQDKEAFDKIMQKRSNFCNELKVASINKTKAFKFQCQTMTEADLAKLEAMTEAEFANFVAELYWND